MASKQNVFFVIFKYSNYRTYDFSSLWVCECNYYAKDVRD